MSSSDFYNIALDCIDKHAHSLVNKHKTALIYVKEGSGDMLQQPPLRLSFSSLQGLSNAAANMFCELGVQQGDRVILRLLNCPEFPINFLGAIKAGVIPIPTSPLLTWHELEFLLQDSEASTLVTTEELLPREIFSQSQKTLKHIIVISSGKDELKTYPGKSNALSLQVHRWQTLLKEASAAFDTQPTLADAPAYWLYTSGTSGRPKAVIHAHRSIHAHDSRAQLWQDLRAGDVIFNTSALNWSYALTCGMLDVWRHGLSSVIYQGSPQPERLGQIIQRYGVTTFMSVPGIYRRLLPYLAEHEAAFSGLRVCLSAGEKLPLEVREEFRKFTGLTIYEGLGMTEHSVYLVQRYGGPIVEGSCGKPLPGQGIAILREDLSEASIGESGILATHRSCEGLMLGYFNRPEEEAETFRGDWFLSGDLAYQDQEGNFFFIGRNDDVITSGGYRISPMEIEAVLNQNEMVEESAAIGIEISPGKTLVQACIVAKSGVPLTQETANLLLAYASTQLAKYKVPRQIIFLKKLPKTSNGKIQRRELVKNLQ
jgi:acetyl-CoA synthetase